MKFSYRQILASAGGAVLSAVIASVFGVKGTIVGVAIGSVAATTGTALVFQSIERTNKAVKQVAVRAPESSRLLRRLGGTNAAGITEATPGESSALTEATATSAVAADATMETETTEPAVTQQMGPPPGPPGPGDPSGAENPTDSRRRVGWPVVVAAVFGVFLFSLLFVTVVELIAGRPLADLFGHGGGGTTVERIFQSPTTTLPLPTTTTTTTSTNTSSTTTPTTSSSTTTSVGGSTTSTTGVGSTSTTSPSSSSTTTTTVSGTTVP